MHKLTKLIAVLIFFSTLAYIIVGILQNEDVRGFQAGGFLLTALGLQPIIRYIPRPRASTHWLHPLELLVYTGSYLIGLGLFEAVADPILGAVWMPTKAEMLWYFLAAIGYGLVWTEVAQLESYQVVR